MRSCRRGLEISKRGAMAADLAERLSGGKRVKFQKGGQEGGAL